MATNNNFSPLPWYDSVAEQDSRKWWKYGNIYPLYCPSMHLIPSQFVNHGHTTGPIYSSLFAPATVQDGYWIDNAGTPRDISSPVSKVQVYRIGPDGIPAGSLLGIRCPEGFVDGGVTGQGWSIDDSSYVNLASGTSSMIDLSDYPTARWLWVEVADPNITDRVWLSTGEGVCVPDRVDLLNEDGEFIMDLFQPGFFAAKEVGDDDIIYTPLDSAFKTELAEGRYYIKAADRKSEWVSDIFTVVKDTMPFLILEWWDDNDFVMDAGAILYKGDGGLVDYHNRLLLCADIAKPTYEFEEEGDTRDGVFYPTKQISKKKYAMHFLANEPLLDVLRFVRMADHINIGYYIGGQFVSLQPTAFLITPEWESEGDFAGVGVEFETDTIAKKLGLAYIRG